MPASAEFLYLGTSSNGLIVANTGGDGSYWVLDSDAESASAGDTLTLTFYSAAGIQQGTQSVTYLGTTSTGAVVVDLNGATVYLTNDLSDVQSGAAAEDYDSDVDFVCFAAGTMIAAPDGARAVETLRPGDLVLTAEGSTARVTWIGRQTRAKLFLPAERFCPVRISAGTLAPGMPEADLTVTADHGIVFAEAIIHAAALVNGTTISRVPKPDLPDRVTYYHVETETHAVILANGCPAETFVDAVTRARFDNHAEFLALTGGDVPALRPLDLPRATGARQVPAAIRDRLARRATEMAAAILAG